MAPTFELGRDFVQRTYPQVSSSCVYSFGSYRVDKQTNKQTDAVKTSNALWYALTLGKNLESSVTSKVVTAEAADDWNQLSIVWHVLKTK